MMTQLVWPKTCGNCVFWEENKPFNFIYRCGCKDSPNCSLVTWAGNSCDKYQYQQLSAFSVKATGAGIMHILNKSSRTDRDRPRQTELAL